MHEMSIVAGVLDSVIPAARDAGATRVTRITLRIGDMADIVDEALTFAFEALTEDTLCEGAVLEVLTVHPRSMCLECGAEFDHDRFHRACTSCGSFETKPIRGRELEIASIEVDLPDEAPDSALDAALDEAPDAALDAVACKGKPDDARDMTPAAAAGSGQTDGAFDATPGCNESEQSKEH